MTAWVRWILATLRLCWARTSDREIRRLFNYLAHLDSDEFLEVFPAVTVHGQASYVHVKHGREQFTVSTALDGRLIVQEWTGKLIAVDRNYPHYSHMKTQWREVYRSGVHVRSVHFVRVLREVMRGVQVNHRRLATDLQEFGLLATEQQVDGTEKHFPLDECVYDELSPGFVLRASKQRRHFLFLTYAEAVKLLAPAIVTKEGAR